MLSFLVFCFFVVFAVLERVSLCFAALPFIYWSCKTHLIGHLDQIGFVGVLTS